jgi:hypothetical protein
MATKVTNKRRGTPTPKTSSPLSAATMGKALVLLATTCAALSTRRHAPARRGFEVSTHKIRSDRITVLHYRDLDDYHVASTVELAAAAGSMDVRGVATPRQHRAISEITPKSQPLHEEQIVMDEYLEFVERRYTRMMLKQRAATKSVVQQSIFSPGKFIRSTLVYSSPASPAPVARPDNEALQALGLTNLASDRLRQRLQAPREFRNEHESAVHLFQYFANADKLVGSATETSSGGRLSPHVGLGFLAQWSLLLQSLGKFLKAYLTSLQVMANFAVRVVPAILERGGLRHSVRILSVASVAILLLFRPLVRGFVKRA